MYISKRVVPKPSAFDPMHSLIPLVKQNAQPQIHTNIRMHRSKLLLCCSQAEHYFHSPSPFMVCFAQ